MDASPVTAPAPADVLGPAGARVAFRCRDRDVTCAEALVALELRGGWDEVVAEVVRGETALRGTDGATLADLDDQVRAAEAVLRRRLGLTAADDYVAWLERHDLSVGDCRDQLRRSLVIRSAAPVDPSALPDPAAVRAHVVVDGVLDDAVQRLAEDAALADVDPTSTSWLVDVVDRAAAERAAPQDPGAVADVLAERTVDWTRVRATLAVVPDDDVAHELVLCVREQHAPLATIAHGVGVPTTTLSTTVGELDPWLEPALLGAEPGALLGPVAHPDGRAVVELVSREHPAPDDRESVALAEAELLRRRIAIALADRVRWSSDA